MTGKVSIVCILEFKHMLRVCLCLCLESADVEQIAVEAVIDSNGVLHCDSVPEGESDCYQKQTEDNWCQNAVLFDANVDHERVRLESIHHHLGSHPVMKCSENC